MADLEAVGCEGSLLCVRAIARLAAPRTGTWTTIAMDGKLMLEEGIERRGDGNHV